MITSYAKFYNRTIASARMSERDLRLRFVDGSGVKLFDDGQSCCEYRYMRTDDDVQDLVGAELLGVEEKDGPEADDCGDVHEQRFLEIRTSRGHVLIANHNEHNGYYGGFALAAEELAPEERT